MATRSRATCPQSLFLSATLQVRQSEPVVVDDEVFEIVERDLVGEDDLAVQRIGGALF
jgi:hypothetical protein